MDLGLAGKAVLITGAAGGAGRATALAFAGEGARLALAGRIADFLEAVASDAEGLGAKALEISNHAYVLELGKSRDEGSGEAIRNDERVKRLYLGR